MWYYAFFHYYYAVCLCIFAFGMLYIVDKLIESKGIVISLFKLFAMVTISLLCVYLLTFIGIYVL